jgi:uncharacterized protein (TIGR03435 family)
MKGLLSTILALAALGGGAAHAQEGAAGTWQGTLRAGQQDLRLVFVVSERPDGLGAMMYSIDQGAQGVTASDVSLRGSTLRIAIAAANGGFEGELSADGSTATGRWTQGAGSLPLTLARATPETAWALPEAPRPMAADAPAAFEVATIRPSNPNQPGKLFTVKGRQVLTINTTLADLITFAYGLHARQIDGGPSWMTSDPYDVTGLPGAPGIPNQEQLRGMVRQLLEDRFQLAFHRETRDQSVYAIVMGEGGHKLARNDSNPQGLPSLLFRGLGMLPAVNATMADLAGVMQAAVMDRPVVDRTGLEGRYDFTIRWTPDESQFAGLGVRVPPPSDDPNAPPGLFTAFQEQLGLKLESTRAPAEVLVIDRVERPSEN